MKAYVENLATSLKDSDSDFLIKKHYRIPRILPNLAFRVGEVLGFSYENKEYIICVISTKKAPTGRYTSSRGNKLVTCVILDLNSAATQIILSAIYRKKKRSNYLQITDKFNQIEDTLSKYFLEKQKDNKINIHLFGKDNFRTFIINKVTSLRKIILEKGDNN